MRALGFDVRKAEVLKLMKDYDRCVFACLLCLSLVSRSSEFDFSRSSGRRVLTLLLCSVMQQRDRADHVCGLCRHHD